MHRNKNVYSHCREECQHLCRTILSVSRTCRKVFNEEELYTINSERGKTIISKAEAIAELDKRKYLDFPKRKIRISNVYAVNDYLVKTMISLARPLLICELYKERLAIGRYLVEYATDDDDVETGYIDFLGWTYSLLGETEKARINIEKGLKMIKDAINSSLDAEKKSHLAYREVRAYRHLGSDANLLKKDPQKAIDYLSPFDEKGDYVHSSLYNNFKASNETNKHKGAEMDNGIRYGLTDGYFHLFLFHSRGRGCPKKAAQALEKASLLLSDENFGMAPSLRFPNQQRYFKWLLLSNEIRENAFRKLQKVKDEEIKDILFSCMKNVSMKDDKKETTRQVYIQEYEDTLSKIDSVLNKLIYVDEAMGTFFSQKKQSLEECLNLLSEEQI